MRQSISVMMAFLRMQAGYAACSLAMILAISAMLVATHAAAAGQNAESDEWIPLFGKNWDRDWRESRFNRNGPKTGKHLFFHSNGVVTTLPDQFRPGHLYYVGPIRGGQFHNFEVKVDVKLAERGNGGLYFRAPYTDWGWPKNAFEIKFNNNHHQYDRTGSLHNTVRVHQSTVKDNEWFELHLIVDGDRFVSRINGETLVEWQRPPDDPRSTVGTFVLQKHTWGISFRNLRVKILP